MTGDYNHGPLNGEYERFSKALGDFEVFRPLSGSVPGAHELVEALEFIVDTALPETRDDARNNQGPGVGSGIGRYFHFPVNGKDGTPVHEMRLFITVGNCPDRKGLATLSYRSEERSETYIDIARFEQIPHEE